MLPRFLWNSICAYLSCDNTVKLDRICRLPFREEDWKNTFLNHRVSPIAIVKISNVALFSWYTSCINYIGCATIKEAIDTKLQAARPIGEMVGFKIFFNNGEFVWDEFDYGMIDMHYVRDTIELIVSIHNGKRTTFKSDKHNYMGFVVGGIMSIENICFDNITTEFFNKEYEDNKPKQVILTSCDFGRVARFNSINIITITHSIFTNTCIVLLDFKIYATINVISCIFRDSLWCINVLRLVEKVNITISNSKITNVSSILYSESVIANPISFVNNYISAVRNCTVGGADVKFCGNEFVDVVHPLINNTNADKIWLGSSNQFVDSDVLLPYVRRGN